MAPVVEKAETKSSTEVVDPLKQAVVIIEHKIRNLEKRRKKIETYQEEQLKGTVLNADQLSALGKHEEVLRSLELAHDLKKQFEAVYNEAGRVSKKQAKKEAHEKSLQEAARIKQILIIQDVLQNMGLDEVREDFLAGRNNAVRITEEELGYLDQIYDEIFPKRVPDEPEEKPLTFDERLQRATEHLIHITEGKNKDVVGTSYRKLQDIVTRIHTCRYFNQEQGQAGQVIATEATVAVNQKKESLNMANKSKQSNNGWS